jgi:hypothetical protein
VDEIDTAAIAEDLRSALDGGGTPWPMAIASIQPGEPHPAAGESLARRVLAPSPLRTADWQMAPVEIRESLFFSAAVEKARHGKNKQKRDFFLALILRFCNSMSRCDLEGLSFDGNQTHDQV